MQEMSINIPSGVKLLLDRLFASGFRADVVGGCVRDTILGKSANDWDVTTSATPDEMKQVFCDMRVIETGIKHGTLTVLVDKVPYEITSYRTDGEYSDGRHPDSVSFTRDIAEDLSRRDFTVNALAYNPRDGLTDLFGGLADLEAGVIRAVGEADKRFSEDALRILRAIRFSSVLGFDIEENTAAAIHRLKHLLSAVSRERICVEWTKLLGGANAYGVINEYTDVIREFIPSLNILEMPEKGRFDFATAEIRELSLFASSALSPEDYYSAMTELKSDNKRKLRGRAILKAVSEDTSSDIAMRRLLRKYGEDIAKEAVELKILLGREELGAREGLLETIKGCPCHRVSDMKIGGKELLEIGIKGVRVGVTLEHLLDLIIEKEVENDKEALLDKAKAF